MERILVRDPWPGPRTLIAAQRTSGRQRETPTEGPPPEAILLERRRGRNAGNQPRILLSASLRLPGLVELVLGPCSQSGNSLRGRLFLGVGSAGPGLGQALVFLQIVMITLTTTPLLFLAIHLLSFIFSCFAELFTSCCLYVQVI